MFNKLSRPFNAFQDFRDFKVVQLTKALHCFFLDKTQAHTKPLKGNMKLFHTKKNNIFSTKLCIMMLSLFFFADCFIYNVLILIWLVTKNKMLTQKAYLFCGKEIFFYFNFLHTNPAFQGDLLGERKSAFPIITALFQTDINQWNNTSGGSIGRNAI